MPIGSDMDDAARKAAATKRKKDKERAISSVEKLRAEQTAQIDRHSAIMKRLSTTKNEWFNDTSAVAATADTMNHFLQHCIFPRCVFSPADAVYCAKFVQQTHAQGTPYFSTLQYYDKLLRDLSTHIFCCTERQAANLGRFLKESLQLLMHWKSSEQVFAAECAKLPGFAVSFQTPSGKKASYEDYVRVVFKWYCKILKSIMSCLESKEYMEVRNALHVLTRIVDVFPVMKRLADLLDKRVAALREDERPDLQTLAAQYYAHSRS